ncbi:hypothetical protein OIV83_001674 [Microbotryomycetes sp. JL201]|nr:hypothetical protein OIV83_001674 [Microbotryomycetes sp. JL201]
MANGQSHPTPAKAGEEHMNSESGRGTPAGAITDGVGRRRTATPASSDSRRSTTTLHQTIPTSYAYGAPSVGKPRAPAGAARALGHTPHHPTQMGPARDHHQADRDGNGDGDSDDSERASLAQHGDSDEDGRDADVFTGRSNEPAHVRYARIKQRKRDNSATVSPAPQQLLHATGQANPANGGTHTLAATATATGARPPFTPGLAPQGTTVNIATAFAQAVAGQSLVGAGRYKQTHNPVANGNRDDDAEPDDAQEDEDGSGKETHVAGGPAGQPGSKKRKKRAPKDPSYKPSEADESVSEDAASDSAHQIHSKRSKLVVGHGQTREHTLPQSAKKATRRKPADPTYKPGAKSDNSEDESDSEEASRRRAAKGKSRASEPGAIPIGQRDSENWRATARKRKARRSTQGHDLEAEFAAAAAGGPLNGAATEDANIGGMHPNDHLYDDTFDSSREPPQTSFFLQAKTAPQNPVPARGLFGRSASTDPAFAEFDRTLDEDSGLRNSSYDYSEEERIVAALEQQKMQAQKGPREAEPTPPNDNAGLRRRNKMPAPPGGLDGIIEESSAPLHDGLSNLASNLTRVLSMALRKLFNWARDPLLDWSKILKAAGLAFLALSLAGWLLSTSRSPKASYTAPMSAPQTLDEVIRRLSRLESAFDHLSTTNEADRAETKSSRSEVARLALEVLQLEQNGMRDRQTAAKALDSSVETQNKARQQVESTVKAIRADLDSVSKRVRDFGDNTRLHADAIQRLNAGIDTLGSQVAKLDTSVGTLNNEMRAGIDGDRIAQIALDAIEARLPSKLAVQLDSAGKLRIDPVFWNHLRDAFAERSQVDKIVRTEVAKLVHPTGQIPALEHTREQPSWDEFVRSNQVSLRSWIASEIDGRSGPDAIVSRRTFMDTLKREIRSLKTDFESKFNENVEQIGREILDKVAKQDEMKRGAGGLASHLNPFHSRNKHSETKVVIESRDGQNVTAIIHSLVDSALLRYSKDVLGRPDYALFSAGGRIVRSLTSPTYEPHPVGSARKALAWVTGSRAPRGLPPVIALQPGTTPGSCWPFAGQQGQIGIQLSRRIVPTDVTIEHASVDVAVDGSVASAPRDIEVWAVVDSPLHVERLAQYRHQQLEEAKRKSRTTIDEEIETEPTSVPPTPNHMLLAVGTYDVTNPSPIQTFPVTSAAKHLAIPVNVVIVRVLSNHGEKSYTCLYRVRVGGVTESMLNEQS